MSIVLFQSVSESILCLLQVVSVFAHFHPVGLTLFLLELPDYLSQITLWHELTVFQDVPWLNSPFGAIPVGNYGAIKGVHLKYSLLLEYVER